MSYKMPSTQVSLELFPCVAIETRIKSRSVRNVKDFYNKVKDNNSNSLNCYLNTKDAIAGTDFMLMKAEKQ